jgi:hypothetical protein
MSAINPFNEHATRLIYRMSSKTTVYLYRPSPLCTECNRETTFDDETPCVYDVSFSNVSGCLIIQTTTLEFYGKALIYLKRLYGPITDIMTPSEQCPKYDGVFWEVDEID